MSCLCRPRLKTRTELGGRRGQDQVFQKSGGLKNGKELLEDGLATVQHLPIEFFTLTLFGKTLFQSGSC